MKAPKSDAVARRAFWVAAPLLVVGASFLAGVYSADRKNIAYRAVQTVKSEVKQVLHELPGQLDTAFPMPEAGRALQIDASGKVVWEYINRFNDDYVLKITEARLYPESYFTVTDWTCPEKG